MSATKILHRKNCFNGIEAYLSSAADLEVSYELFGHQFDTVRLGFYTDKIPCKIYVHILYV